MRAELTTVGFEELKSSEQVDQTIPNSKGTMLLVLNSVCGCAAGTARPGVRMSLEGTKKPEKLVTVFAGQDMEATAPPAAAFARERMRSWARDSCWY